MSSQDRPLKRGDAGQTLHSRCQPAEPDPLAKEAGPLGCRYLSCAIAPSGEEWWSQTGSNRRPHACKARALPTELWPRLRQGFGGQALFGFHVCEARPPKLQRRKMVGPGRLELPTLRLSGVRSNHLSYRPMAAAQATLGAPGLAIAPHARPRMGRQAAREWKEKQRRRRSAPV